jgi:uncharacterized protein
MDTFEFNVDESLRPSAERKLTGTTKIDTSISSLPIRTKHLSTTVAVYLLRLYRQLAPQVIRCRCVFDPSCSHYSELAFRQQGLLKGANLTFKRLRRCKPDAGGIDFSGIKQGD